MAPMGYTDNEAVANHSQEISNAVDSIARKILEDVNKKRF